MIHAQNTKLVTVFTPQSFGTSATTSATVSVVGWDYAQIILQLATGTNTDTTAQVQEADGTSYATHADLAMTTAATSTSVDTFYSWLLDLRKRKKNLKVVYQPATGARIGSGVIILSRGDTAPTTAALRGISSQVVA